MTPFIIHALPRSRTAWLAEFLTYEKHQCYHEAAIHMRSLDDVMNLFRDGSGSAETAMMYGWPLLRHHLPELRTVVIRRPVADVVTAMMNVDLEGEYTYDHALLTAAMVRGDRCLSRISALPGTLTAAFSDLEREDTCRAIWEHCLPLPFDRVWWRHLSQINVQVPVVEVLRYFNANTEAIDRFKGTCMRELRRLAYAGHIGRTKGA